MCYFSVLIYVICAGEHLPQVRGEQPLPQWRRPSLGKFFIFSLYIFLEMILISHRLLSDNLINQIINNTAVMFVVVWSKLLTLKRKKNCNTLNLKKLWSSRFIWFNPTACQWRLLGHTELYEYQDVCVWQVCYCETEQCNSALRLGQTSFAPLLLLSILVLVLAQAS